MADKIYPHMERHNILSSELTVKGDEKTSPVLAVGLGSQKEKKVLYSFTVAIENNPNVKFAIGDGVTLIFGIDIRIHAFDDKTGEHIAEIEIQKF